MARTWTYHDTIVPDAGIEEEARVTQAGDNLVYIGPDNNGDFYSYDGTTLTNIGFEAWANAQGGDWDVGNDHGKGCAYFNGKLYIAANKDSSFEDASIVEYNPVGAGTFTEVKDFGGWQWIYNNSGAGKGYNCFIQADDDRIVTYLFNATPTPSVREMWTSTNGTSWNLASGIEMAYTAQDMVLGKEYSRQTVLSLDGDTSDATISRVIQAVGAGWTDLSGSDLTNTWLVGYVDSLSWFVEPDGANWQVTKSNNWGVTTSTGTGALGFVATNTGFRIRNIADDAQIMGYATVNRVFEYNDATGLFEFSQELYYPGPANVRGFIDSFYLGSTVYILAYGGIVFEGGTLADNQARLLGMAADSKNIYLTANLGGILKLFVLNQDTLTDVSTKTFGSATFAEIDSRAKGIFPVIEPGADGVLYLRGRDGNDIHVQKSEDYGVTFTDKDDAGWVAGKYAIGLFPDPLNTADIVVPFGDDDIYQSDDSTASWSKTGDAAVVLREAARHLINEKQLLYAGQSAGAGQLFWTPNVGETDEDVSDAGIDTINRIVQSFD